MDENQPRYEWCTGVYLDGPLGGQVADYALNELGSRSEHALPPGDYEGNCGYYGPAGIYEVVTLAESGHPAELRFVRLATLPPG